jgi:hypothetical protein
VDGNYIAEVDKAVSDIGNTSTITSTDKVNDFLGVHIEFSEADRPTDIDQIYQ